MLTHIRGLFIRILSRALLHLTYAYASAYRTRLLLSGSEPSNWLDGLDIKRSIDQSLFLNSRSQRLEILCLEMGIKGSLIVIYNVVSKQRPYGIGFRNSQVSSTTRTSPFSPLTCSKTWYLDYIIMLASDHIPNAFDWTNHVLLILGDLLGKAGQELLELERGEPGQHCDLTAPLIESKDSHELPSPQLG